MGLIYTNKYFVLLTLLFSRIIYRRCSWQHIRNRTKFKDAIEYVWKLKWKWTVHIARYRDEKWTKLVTERRGPVQGKRRVGRPLKRWDDYIRAIAGPRRLAAPLGRERWAQLEDAFTKMWSDMIFIILLCLCIYNIIVCYGKRKEKKY